MVFARVPTGFNAAIQSRSRSTAFFVNAIGADVWHPAAPELFGSEENYRAVRIPGAEQIGVVNAEVAQARAFADGFQFRGRAIFANVDQRGAAAAEAVAV